MEDKALSKIILLIIKVKSSLIRTLLNKTKVENVWWFTKSNKVKNNVWIPNQPIGLTKIGNL